MNKIDVERLMYLVMEYYDDSEQYCSSAKLPYTKFEGKDISEKLENKRKKLDLYYKWQDKDYDMVQVVSEVLKLDYEQRNRLYSAGRACRRWMQKTEYQRCIPYELLNRLEEYIFGNGKENYAWQV